MKAIVCTKYGTPEVLQFQDVEKPTPKANEILIKIKATTVAVADSRIRSFNVPKGVWLPARLALGLTKPRKKILGVELAGEVEAIGQSVTKFKKGDRIFAASLKNFGAHAAYICLPENDPIALMPDKLTFEQATALPIGGRTALHYLKKANIQKGDQVLIYGASGSVGTYAIQLAKYFGAEVTGVCSEKNSALVKSIGADKVLDYTAPNFEGQLGQYDVIFMAVNKLPFSVCNKALKPKGVYLNITAPFKNLAQLWASLTTKKKLFMGGNVPEKSEYLDTLKELVEADKLTPVIDRIYPFEEIIEAHRYVDKGHKKGNVVVRVG